MKVYIFMNTKEKETIRDFKLRFEKVTGEFLNESYCPSVAYLAETLIGELLNELKQICERYGFMFFENNNIGFPIHELNPEFKIIVTDDGKCGFNWNEHAQMMLSKVNSIINDNYDMDADVEIDVDDWKPCEDLSFTINSIDALVSDFGIIKDLSPNKAPDYGCGNMQFVPHKFSRAQREELALKYNINLKDIKGICELLKDKFNVCYCDICC